MEGMETKLKVLVADDLPQNRTAIELLLEER